MRLSYHCYANRLLRPQHNKTVCNRWRMFSSDWTRQCTIISANKKHTTTMIVPSSHNYIAMIPSIYNAMFRKKCFSSHSRHGNKFISNKNKSVIHLMSDRNFATSLSNTNPNTNNKVLVYEGPFASLALRLKRISISTAVVSLLGMPLLIALQGGNIPISGQLAVGGTAILAATGSTAALSYCFSPYVHSLEWTEEQETGTNDDSASGKKQQLLKAKTRNFFSLPVETVFDPRTDVEYDVSKKTNRPFCNFIANGVPLFVHPNLIHEAELKLLLFGPVKDSIGQKNTGEGNDKKDDEDIF